VILPSSKSPEQLISQFLYDLDEGDELWENVGNNFSHQFCFKDFTNEQIQDNREIAKDWFNNHKAIWGVNSSKIFKPWIKANKDASCQFLLDFKAVYNSIANKKGFDIL
jgi:hypothetical protein